MEHLARGLGPFVDQRMAAAFPAGQDWIQSLAARNPSRFAAGHRYSVADPRFLLRVVTEEWRTFRDQLSRVEQGYATELKDAGNRWAHGEPFSADDTYRALDTMERLLTATGAAEQANQIRALRLHHQQPAIQPAASTSHAGMGRPDAAIPTRTERTSVSWSRVTHADVVRAVEEYDRLGQDQFLTEHGFGRAAAYLLLYRGRSYDSKAILGVAYKFATGVRIGAHDFSGGVHGAAGVLRKLGFEVRNTRDPAPGQTGSQAAPANAVGSDLAGLAPSRARRSPAEALKGIVPEGALLVLTCSGRKDKGGAPPRPAEDPGWPQHLLDARTRVLAASHADSAHVLPAWRRYTGTFYQHARPALADAAARGNVVIISGGYGIARAGEPIGWYDKILQLADWPAGLLESALISEAQRCGTQTVIAFASATTGYAKLLRRTPWEQAGIDARLVTTTGVTAGAMTEVPRQLGQAFSAFWNQTASYPPSTTVENLR
jgi:hypothetical protein